MIGDLSVISYTSSYCFLNKSQRYLSKFNINKSNYPKIVHLCPFICCVFNPYKTESEPKRKKIAMLLGFLAEKLDLKFDMTLIWT